MSKNVIQRVFVSTFFKIVDQLLPKICKLLELFIQILFK